MQHFYDLRRAALGRVEPNPAHLALARLDDAWEGELLIVTQNVDDLHERGGARRLLHMHGELKRALCQACGGSHAWEGDLSGDHSCPGCAAPGELRPDIVWFGEMPYHMETIDAALRRADLFVSIGTSGVVYPAAGFVALARRAGARCLEINLDASEGSGLFHESRRGRAGEFVPAWVDELLGA